MIKIKYTQQLRHTTLIVYNIKKIVQSTLIKFKKNTISRLLPLVINAITNTLTARCIVIVPIWI